MKHPLRIAITPELLTDANMEAAMVRAVLDAGWDAVHLRHPSATFADMRRLVGVIPPVYHQRLRLHGHFDLVAEYNIGGLHLNSRCPSVPAGYNGKVSRSCHSVDEALAADGFEYVTLSPIFDSISKAGYRAAFTPAMLERLAGRTTRVVALGGVTPERTSEIERYNFDGYAVLGALPWNGTVEEMTTEAKKFK